MTIAVDRTNQIITLAAKDDALDEVLDIQGILFFGTAAGKSEVRDSNDNVLAQGGLTTTTLSFYVPLNRRVDGVKASLLATGHTVFIYCKN